MCDWITIHEPTITKLIDTKNRTKNRLNRSLKKIMKILRVNQPEQKSKIARTWEQITNFTEMKRRKFYQNSHK